LEALEDRWLPSQIGLTVSSLADSGPGTLRAAILTADAGKASDQFTIGFGVNGTIDLQSPLPDLNASITIQGPGASSLTVERAAGASLSFAIVTVDAGQTASLSGLTIANGNVGGVVNSGTLSISSCVVSGNSSFSGGGIDNGFGATMTVSGCTISDNFAAFVVSAGGGIYNAGTLTVTGSTISGNSASGVFFTVGGGIENAAGTLTINGCTISGNFSHSIDSSFPGNSGGIENDASATVTDSTISGNSADSGAGGIGNGGTLTINGSAISGNTATYGGGIYNAGTLTVAKGSNLCGNSATFGGGIFNANSSLTIRDTAFTANTATQGGGIYNTAVATLDVRGTTFTDNSASDSGGGIYNLGTATLQECTLSANTATNAGGGFFNGASGTLRVKDSTVLNNVAPSGADIYNLGVLIRNDSTVGVIGP
jgi:predicted outer membrane repeat protein